MLVGIKNCSCISHTYIQRTRGVEKEETLQLILLLNKNGVTKRQTLEAEAGEKGKKVFIQMLNNLEEWGTPHLKVHLLCKTETKCSCAQQD